MYCTKCERYPNGEIRITTYRENKKHIPPGGIVGGEDKSVPLPSCHSRKTLNGGGNTDEQGDKNSASAAGYGTMGRPTNFSTYGRRRVLRCGAALERTVPKEECYMATLTVPGSDEDSLRCVAEHSSYLVQRLKAWFGKRISSPLSLYCWEWQKRGALHLHYVMHCPDRSAAQYISTNLKAEWTRLLNAISRKSGVDVWRRWDGTTWKNSTGVLRVEFAQVKKSVAAYLAKYISKGSEKVKGFSGHYFYPVRWYGVSRPLSALLKKTTQQYVYISGKLSEAQALHEDCLSLLTFEESKVHHWRHKVGVGKTTAAYIPQHLLEKTWKQVMEIVPQPSESATALTRKSLNWCRNSKALMTRYPQWQSCFTQLSSEYVRKIHNGLSDSLSMSGLDLEYLVDSYLYTLRWYQRTRSNIPATLSSHAIRGEEIQSRWSSMSFREKLDVTVNELTQ